MTAVEKEQKKKIEEEKTKLNQAIHTASFNALSGISWLVVLRLIAKALNLIISAFDDNPDEPPT